MKPKLILHIGLHKTGTTHIQSLLQKNETRLLDLGFFLPDRLGRTDGGFQRVTKLIRSKGVAAFLDHISGDPERVTIVSSESLSAILPGEDPDTARRLRGAFDVQIILFLRRQDYLRESAFAQVVKSGKTGTIDAYQYDLFDTKPLVQKLIDEFGQDNIKGVIYRDDGDFDSWSVFCECLGLRNSTSSQELINGSPHRRKTLLLSQIEESNRRKANLLLQAVAATDAIEDDGLRHLASLESRIGIVQRYRSSNERVCTQLGLDAGYMSALPDDDWFPPKPITNREWVVVLQNLLATIE